MYEEQAVEPQFGAEQVQSAISREEPQVDAARKNLVKEWLGKIEAAEKHWEKDFKRMREDMQLAYAGAPKDWMDDDKFVVPIIKRHINQTVAGLYAKNPRVVVEPKKRMDYTLWDGRADTLQAALETMAMAASPPVADPMTGAAIPPPPPDPNAVALIQEVSQVQTQKLMLKRVCKTMEILLTHYMKEQSPSFKKQLKQLVRRAKTCGVGYVFLGFQRMLEKRPEISARIEDVSAQIARVESLSADLQDGLMPEDSARLDELKSMMADLQKQEEIITREGPVFDFPRATEIIVDPKCKQLNTLVGAGWFARKFHLSPEEVQEIYKVDIKKNGGFKSYEKMDNGSYRSSEWSDVLGEDEKPKMACVYEVWSKTTGQTFTLIEGYCTFIKEPESPEFRLERFWPLFPLTFNDVEHEDKLFPLSDVNDLRHSQNEYNRSREGRRQHRKANQPMYISIAGRLSEADKSKLALRPPHAIVELGALAPGETAEQLLQGFKPVPMQAELYETNSEMEDVYRTVGAQEANLGGTSGATATESSIAEGSRMSSQDSNVDDLDEMLSELVGSTGELLLLTLDIQTVKRIAGPGAEWPQMSRSEIVEQVMADVKAGSSGRPNKAADLADLERGTPYLLQMSGVKMQPIAEKYGNLLDIDTDELIAEGMPSQVALNAMASKLQQGAAGQPQLSTGNPASDPAQQGAAGASNAPSSQPNEQGPQPAYPAPNSV